MNELIKVSNTNFNGEQKQTVNARDLHAFLESKQRFSDWIKDRIEQFGFIEGEDYVCHKIMTQYNQIDRIDYFLSLDMAKELSMVERNAKGKQARQYFIECERIAKAPQPMTLEQLLQHNVMMIQDLSNKVVTLETTVKQQAPAVAAIERLGSSKGSMCLTDAAKALDMNPKAFMAWLEMNGWIFKRVAGDNWTAYQTKIDAGYLEMISVSTGELGQEKMRKQCKVTASGMVKLAKLFDAINGNAVSDNHIFSDKSAVMASLAALGIRKPSVNGMGA